MKTLNNFDNFKIIVEANEHLDSFLDHLFEISLNENIGAALGSPVKFLQIKSASKKYQTAIVQKSINDLDFEKKKAAGTLDAKQKEVLAAANKQKNLALTDKASAIAANIDTYATTPGLKTIASIAKNKSKIAAATITARVADGEEAKALKLKIQDLNKKIANDSAELKDYVKTTKAKDDAKTDTQSSPDNTSTDQLASLNNDAAEKKEAAKKKEAAQEMMVDKTSKLENDIKEIDANITDEMTAISKLKSDLKQSKIDVSAGRGSDADILKNQKRLNDSTEDLAELTKRKAELKKDLLVLQKESVSHVNESIATKFNLLYNNMNV
jgi:chromosome segregation ATPase